MFFGFPKEVGGFLRMPHFSPEMAWHTLSFSTYVHTYIHTCMHSTRPWRDHYKPDFLAEIFLGVGGAHPPCLKYFSFYPSPLPPLRGDIPTYLLHIYLHTCYIPTCLHAYTPTDLRNYAPTYLHAYIPTHLPTHLPIYLHTDINVYIHTYIHT